VNHRVILTIVAWTLFPGLIFGVMRLLAVLFNIRGRILMLVCAGLCALFAVFVVWRYRRNRVTHPWTPLNYRMAEAFGLVAVVYVAFYSWPQFAPFEILDSADETIAPEVKELPPQAPGWMPLFNGKDLAGFNTNLQLSRDWKVEDGLLVGHGNRGSLFSTRDDYQNFHYRVVAKINAIGTAGQLFRSGYTPLGNGGYAPPNYEACISAGSKSMKTGALQRFNAVGGTVFAREQKELLVPADTWFTQEVIADGTRLIVKVNDKVVSDIDESKLGERGVDAPRQGRLGLRFYGADEKPVLHVRKIEIKELPASNYAGPAAGVAVEGTKTPLPAKENRR